MDFIEISCCHCCCSQVFPCERPNAPHQSKSPNAWIVQYVHFCRAELQPILTLVCCSSIFLYLTRERALFFSLALVFLAFFRSVGLSLILSDKKNIRQKQRISLNYCQHYYRIAKALSIPHTYQCQIERANRTEKNNHMEMWA